MPCGLTIRPTTTCTPGAFRDLSVGVDDVHADAATADAPITVRRAVAVRPPRPITLPRSSGCTCTSRVRPRRVVTMSTCTSSGLSTMPRTRCSRASASKLTPRRPSSPAGTLSGGLGLLRLLGLVGLLTLVGLVGLLAALLLGRGGLGRRLPSAAASAALNSSSFWAWAPGDLQRALGTGQALELLPVAGDLQDALDGLGGLSANLSQY